MALIICYAYSVNNTEALAFMKYFVLTVLRLFDRLEEFYDALDKAAVNSATSVMWDAEELCDYLMEINDKKRLLANMKVMRDEIIGGVGERDAELLTQYACGVSTEKLAEKESVNRSTAMRRINGAVNESISVLSRLGIDKEKVENEYFSLPAVKSAYCKTAALRAPKRPSRLIPRNSAAFSCLLRPRESGTA